MASYACDSDIFDGDSSTNQVSTNMGESGALHFFEVEKEEGIYKKRFELPIPEGSFMIHSHPEWSEFPNGPSPDDQKKATQSKAIHFVYGLKEGILSIFDGLTEAQVGQFTPDLAKLAMVPQTLVSTPPPASAKKVPGQLTPFLDVTKLRRIVSKRFSSTPLRRYVFRRDSSSEQDPHILLANEFLKKLKRYDPQNLLIMIFLDST